MKDDRADMPVVLRVAVSLPVWVWLKERGALDPFGPLSAEEMARQLILEAIDLDLLSSPFDDYEDDLEIPF